MGKHMHTTAHLATPKNNGLRTCSHLKSTAFVRTQPRKKIHIKFHLQFQRGSQTYAPHHTQLAYGPQIQANLSHHQPAKHWP